MSDLSKLWVSKLLLQAMMSVVNMYVLYVLLQSVRCSSLSYTSEGRCRRTGRANPSDD